MLPRGFDAMHDMRCETRGLADTKERIVQGGLELLIAFIDPQERLAKIIIYLTKSSDKDLDILLRSPSLWHFKSS